MKLKISKVHTGPFNKYIKKMLSVDKFVYLKIENDKIYSNVYLPQRDAVKVQQIDASTIFDFDTNISELDKPIKVSFFNGHKLADAFKHFGSDGIMGEITVTETDDDLIATQFTIYNDELSINLTCSDPSLGFMDLTEEQVNSIFDISTQSFTFDIDADGIDRLTSLFALEKENDTFEIVYSDNSLRFKGDTYNALFNQIETGDESHTLKLYKKYLPLLDKETYKAVACNNKIVLYSEDSETQLTIATCQTGE
tara:strand:- start:227 stop:985 length:759 start_codon:yes stop_codon:yes gene_type:complete